MGLLKFVEMKIVCCDNVLGILGIEKSNCGQSIVCLHPSKQVNCLNFVFLCMHRGLINIWAAGGYFQSSCLCLMMDGYRVTDVEKWLITGMVGRKPTWNVKEILIVVICCIGKFLWYTCLNIQSWTSADFYFFVVYLVIT